MKFHGVSIYIPDQDNSPVFGSDFSFLRPVVYDNGTFKSTDIKIYDGSTWKTIGAAWTQMIYLIDSTGKTVCINDEPILILQERIRVRLKDNNGAYLKDNLGNYIYAGGI